MEEVDGRTLRAAEKDYCILRMVLSREEIFEGGGCRALEKIKKIEPLTLGAIEALMCQKTLPTTELGVVTKQTRMF